MNLGSDIEKMKREKMGQIEKAAIRGDVATIFECTRILEKLDKLEKQYNEVLSSIMAIQKQSIEQVDWCIRPRMSPKERGKVNRMKFVEEVRKMGITIEHNKGVLYRILPDNRMIGIAYASERMPNKWFLGLPKEEYYAFVLLCENEYKNVTRFIFPREFYQEHSNTFSEDKKNSQIKFNISLRDGRYTMKLPGKRDLYINAYIDKFENL